MTALTRRKALQLLAIGGAGALGAACSSPAPSAAPVQAPPTVSSSQPRSGGTLRVGILGDLLGLDGHLTTGLDSLCRVCDVVNILDDKLNTIPVLVESLDLTPDARQMTLKLRS